MIKADLKCSSVAAASVLAKVTRDRMMVAWGAEEAYAPYGWVENKGYAAPEHQDALRRFGPCELHRRSWRLPGTIDDTGEVAVGLPPEALEPLEAPEDPAGRDPAPVDELYLTGTTDLTRVGER